ncbi:hypothetical protein I5168_12110 [Nonlabens sp. SCSIO 43208]|uniref:hypothetical protein n=1 Tax=Nonlabens sp. SCSIO 43208 TaxID=2793009 RepID=UPI003D6B1E13
MKTVNEIRNYLLNNNLSSYLVSKETGIAIATIDNIIAQKTNPRSTTLNKLIEYLESHEAKKHLNKVEEPTTEYRIEKDPVSNVEIMNMIQYIGDQLLTSSRALVNNNEAVSELLLKTYNNTKKILKTTDQIDTKGLTSITKKLKNT